MRSSKSFRADTMALQQLRQAVRLVERQPSESIQFGAGGVERKRERGVHYTFEYRGGLLSVWLPDGEPLKRAWGIAREFFSGKESRNERAS